MMKPRIFNVRLVYLYQDLSRTIFRGPYFVIDDGALIFRYCRRNYNYSCSRKFFNKKRIERLLRSWDDVVPLNDWEFRDILKVFNVGYTYIIRGVTLTEEDIDNFKWKEKCPRVFRKLKRKIGNLYL